MVTTRSKASILGVDEHPGIEAAHRVFVFEVERIEDGMSRIGTTASIKHQADEWRAVERIVRAFLHASVREERVCVQCEGSKLGRVGIPVPDSLNYCLGCNGKGTQVCRYEWGPYPGFSKGRKEENGQDN